MSLLRSFTGPLGTQKQLRYKEVPWVTYSSHTSYSAEELTQIVCLFIAEEGMEGDAPSLFSPGGNIHGPDLMRVIQCVITVNSIW